MPLPFVCRHPCGTASSRHTASVFELLLPLPRKREVSQARLQLLRVALWPLSRPRERELSLNEGMALLGLCWTVFGFRRGMKGELTLDHLPPALGRSWWCWRWRCCWCCFCCCCCCCRCWWWWCCCCPSGHCPCYGRWSHWRRRWCCCRRWCWFRWRWPIHRVARRSARHPLHAVFLFGRIA